jgi:hypothetical protein
VKGLLIRAVRRGEKAEIERTGVIRPTVWEPGMGVAEAVAKGSQGLESTYIHVTRELTRAAYFAMTEGSGIVVLNKAAVLREAGEGVIDLTTKEVRRREGIPEGSKADTWACRAEEVLIKTSGLVTSGKAVVVGWIKGEGVKVDKKPKNMAGMLEVMTSDSALALGRELQLMIERVLRVEGVGNPGKGEHRLCTDASVTTPKRDCDAGGSSRGEQPEGAPAIDGTTTSRRPRAPAREQELELGRRMVESQVPIWLHHGKGGADGEGRGWILCWASGTPEDCVVHTAVRKGPGKDAGRQVWCRGEGREDTLEGRVDVGERER